MNYKRLALALSLISFGSLYCPTGAEISAAGSGHAAPTAESAYREYTVNIHKATRADQLPTFSHSSPLNKIKLADSRYEEKEILTALQEMTPHTLKPEGKFEWDNRVYLFFEGDPELAVQHAEYFPITVEMVKEEGTWKLRRQQSCHVKKDTIEAQVIPKGQPRVQRFKDMMGALKLPVPPDQKVIGTIGGKPFKAAGVYFMPRDNYFKLMFVDGRRQFSIYIREGLTLAELQNRHFLITPMEGYEADLMPEQEMFGPVCAKIDFGKIDRHGFVPGTISLSIRTPETVTLSGNFGAIMNQDCLAPDDDPKAKNK